MPLEVRKTWLDQVQEEIVDPDRRIVDPHHHFFVPGGAFPAYDLTALHADTGTHNVQKTVFMQCWEGYRASDPEHLQCVGETEWVDAISKEAAKTPDAAQVAGIIGTAELRAGAAVREVLEAHQTASDLFRGIRLAAAWDPDENIMRMPTIENADLYADPKFREGFKVLDEMGLVFDAYHYHPQTPALADLARAFPNVNIVLDHLGTPLGIGAYANKSEIFGTWQKGIADIASCDNVHIKLGGLAMPWNGFGYDDAPVPPTSDQLVSDQKDYYHYAIDAFGPERCMFESNFPVDKCAVSYTVLWNAFKKMAGPYSAAEKDHLFWGTAYKVYSLD
ncbi:MAG: amidohydrolase family protein [Pseudomonadota bacterium]